MPEGCGDGGRELHTGWYFSEMWAAGLYQIESRAGAMGPNETISQDFRFLNTGLNLYQTYYWKPGINPKGICQYPMSTFQHLLPKS